MSKIDQLKETKSDLKEVFKALLYFILGILTGVATIAYKVLTKEIEAYMILVSGLGLIVVFLLAIYALNLWHRMQKINEEMENA
jgi:fumarate reductase subunit D